MKMHELLSEAPLSANPGTTSSGGIIIPPGSTTHLPSAGATATSQPSTAQTAAKMGSWTRFLRMKSRNAGPKLQNYLTRGDLKDLGASRAARGAGMYLSLLKWLGFYDFAVEYWTNVNILEAMVKSGELDRSDYGPAKRLMAEELAVKVALSNAFPNIIKWFFRLRYLKWIPQILGGLATIFTGGGMAAAEIALILATEAAAIALQNLLKTPAGKEIVSWIVVYAIDPGFKWLYDQGPGRFLGKLREISPEGSEKIKKKTNPDAPIGPAITGLVDKTVPDNGGEEEQPDNLDDLSNKKSAAADKPAADKPAADKDKKPTTATKPDKKPKDDGAAELDLTKALGFNADKAADKKAKA